MELELKLIDLDLAIAKLSDMLEFESLISKSRFFSLTKTEDEISLVIESKCLPVNRFVNFGWKAFKLIGPLEFSLVGILQKVIQPLAENGISIFTISTFETDYVLVKEEQIDRAVEVLSKSFNVRM